MIALGHNPLEQCVIHRLGYRVAKIMQQSRRWFDKPAYFRSLYEARSEQHHNSLDKVYRLSMMSFIIIFLWSFFFRIRICVQPNMFTLWVTLNIYYTGVPNEFPCVSWAASHQHPRARRSPLMPVHLRHQFHSSHPMYARRVNLNIKKYTLIYVGD